jgi:hypothetical protein
LKETRPLWPPQRGVGLREPNLGKTNPRVTLFICLRFVLRPLSRGLDFISNANPACSCVYICKSQFRPIHPPPLGDYHEASTELKYLKRSLVYNGTDEDDFLYYLLDNKEISICWEMARNIGFSKLDVGLSAMSKDDLADNLAYNSLKVQMLLTYEQIIFVSFTIMLILFLPIFVGLNPEQRFKGTEEC